MKPQSPDTHPAAEAVLIEGLRRMGPARRLARVFELREAALSLARARLLERGASLDERAIETRIASTWLPPDVLARVIRYRDERC